MKRASILLILTACMAVFGAVKDIKVLTDNAPDWTNLASAASSMTGSLGSDEQKAIAVWKWIGTFRHQVMPAADSASLAQTRPSEASQSIFNPISIANNFGNTFCITTNSFPPLIWKQLGKNAREYDIVWHTVCDLQWGGAWHNFDAAFGFYYKDAQDFHILDCAEVVSRHLTQANMLSDVTRCNVFNNAIQTNASIYQGKTVADILHGTGEYDSIWNTRNTLFSETYGGGYTYKLAVKPYESYTKRWTQISTTNSKYFLPASITDPAGANPNIYSSGNLNIQSNGIWTFTPDLSNAKALEALCATSNLEQGGGVALHPASPGTNAEFIYRMDAANFISNAVVSGIYKRTSASDVFAISFSADSANWITIYTGAATDTQTFSKDFGTQTSAPALLARTRDHYFLKFTMNGAAGKTDCGLNTLNVTTWTVLNQRTLPKLTLGSNRVKFVMGSGTMEPLELVYYWTECTRIDTGAGTTFSAKQRSFKKSLSSAAEEFLINTAGFRNPVMDSVRLNWPGAGPAAAEGYSDGIDVGTAFEAPKYFYTFGKNIAVGKTCASTPAPTTGTLIGLTDNNTNSAGWTAGLNPEIVVDLTSAVNVGGIRMSQQIQNGTFDYLDSAEVSTSSDNATFAPQGAFYNRQVWEPITNYVHPNTWDAPPTYMPRKNVNIVYNKFSCAFDNGAVSARYVKIKCYNSRAVMTVPEIEVYNQMTRTRVNNEIDNGWTLADPGMTALDRGFVSVERANDGPESAAAAAAIEASPNPFNPSTRLTIFTGKSGIQRALTVTVYDITGRKVATLLQSNVKAGNAVTVNWDASASPSGVYVVKASFGRQLVEKKVTLIK